MAKRERSRSWLMRMHVSKACPSLSEKRRCEKLLRSAVARALHEFEHGSTPCCTIREKLETFLEYRLNGLSRKSCNDKTAALYRRRLLMFDQAFHSAPLDAIRREDVIAWMLRRLEKPRRGKTVTRDTVNAEVGALKAFARWAQENGHAPASLPLLLTPRMQSPGKMAGKNWRPPQVLDIHPLLDIVDAIKARRRDIGLFFHGMLYFNLRPSEVATLRRGDLRLPARGHDGSLECYRNKTFQKLTLPVGSGSFIHDWALECLDLARRTVARVTEDTPLIICITGRSRRNPGGWTTDILDKATARVCEDLGLKIRPYLIRHSITSWLDDQPDVAAAAVTTHAGHLKTTTTELYKHRKAAQAKPAFVAIEKLMKSRVAKTG